MKFTLGWLREHLDTDLDAAGIAARLTAIGLEVEAIENAGEKLADFRVAEVVEAGQHPNADKLQLLSVDAGTGERWQVVCGAPNARSGMKGVFAPPGTYVPGAGFTLKPAKIRDVESFGMMCSTRELELGDDHDGIIELPADAPVGTAFPDYAGLNDPVFDVSITPNRQDCMGVRGIARDLAAAGLGSLKPLTVPDVAGSFESPIAIRIDDSEGCPALFGRAIRGLTNGASPEWMQRRLNSAGQRPISALVDITNYVMIDLGRPSHAYDLTKLDGTLVARRANEGETVEALNGKTYALDPSMTVIADDSQVHDIGGIMGGEDSSVTESTNDVMLEVAYFSPERIARTGQRLALTSDARSRFERGVDPAFLDDGLAILTGLILDICGGEASQAIHAGDPPVETRTILFDTGRTLALGGVDVPEDEQHRILRSLGFACEGHTVHVPSWRSDVDGPADLVEEVARIHGYDKIPSIPLERPAGVAKPTATRRQLLERRVRRAAASRGFDEAVTWSFIGEQEARLFGGGAWRVANPISEDMKVMRPSLLPGLVAATRRNMDRGAPTVRLFEIGRRYLADAERPTATLLLAGERQGRGWQSGKAQGFDAFDGKAAALALLEAAGAPVANLQVFPNAGPEWHPGRSARLGLGPKAILAAFGELHPRIARQLDAPVGIIAAEIYLDAIPEPRAASRARDAHAPAPLQTVSRDFAFIVPSEVPADSLVRAIRGTDKAVITSARVFDRFESAGGLSLAVEVTLQPGDKSFAEIEIADISRRIVAAAEKLGARLRS